MLRRAILSVSDKTGLVSFARVLASHEVELLSTGGTQRALEAEQVPVVGIERYTGSPEVMAGRVKTLHPRVHGGILAREGLDDGDLLRIGGRLIDLVVVNLYPFEQTAARPDASREEVVEQIDIGGPCLLRAAAKNHDRVVAVCDPGDYEPLTGELQSSGSIGAATRRRLAAKAFARTAAYDRAIAGYLEAGL